MSFPPSQNKPSIHQREQSWSLWIIEGLRQPMKFMPLRYSNADSLTSETFGSWKVGPTKVFRSLSLSSCSSSSVNRVDFGIY